MSDDIEEQDDNRLLGEGDPATLTQRSFWLMNQLAANSKLANISAAYRIRGKLSEAQIASAMGSLWDRHPEARSLYRMVGTEVRRFTNAVIPKFEYFDLRDLDEAGRLAKINDVHDRSFDVCIEAPFRPAAFRIAEDQHVMLLASNHIASDEWTGAIAFQDTLAALAHGQDSSAYRKLAPRASYTDFVCEQREFLASAEGRAMLEAWAGHLQDAQSRLALPTNRAHPEGGQYDGASVRYALSAELGEGVRNVAKALKITPFVLLYSVWQLFLSRLCNQNLISQATPMLGRPKKHLRTAGCFSNPTVLRVDLTTANRFSDLAALVHEELQFANSHSQIPFELVLDALGLSRDTRSQPFRQAGFNFRRLSSGKGIGTILNPNHDDQWHAEGAVQIAGYGLRQQEGQHELGLEIFDIGDTIQCLWKYRTALWDRETVESLSHAFQSLLESCLKNPEDRLRALSLTGADCPAAVATGPEMSLPDTTLVNKFVAKASEIPDVQAVAETQSQRTLSYSQLAARSGQLATLLKSRGLGVGKIVGICLPRGIDMVTAVLGSLRSGAAYLPLDHQLPENRLAFMCQDAGADCIITTTVFAERLPDDIDTVLLDDPLFVAELERAQVLDESPAVPGDLAYVIYTSGSTGKPKGVAVEHRAALNDVLSIASILKTGPADTVLATTALSFDPSVEDIFVPLIEGARLVVADENTLRDGAMLAKKIDEWDATIMHMTPAHWSLVLESGWAGKPNLKAVSGGEALLTSLALQLRRKVGTLLNVYGPTESVINCTTHEVQDIPQDTNIVSIGSPKHNTKAFILDQLGQPLPIGLIGELCIGGRPLARGYVNQTDLTQEKFVTVTIDGESYRVYRTGDRARLNRTGLIDYLGRLDDQVKIRGYRIEPGEIEAALRAAPGVRDAAVAAKAFTHSETRLLAFVTPRDNDVQIDAVRDYLSSVLPGYMLPHRIATLTKLPLNANGKVDRQALIELPVGENRSANLVPPNPGIELELAAIWAETLEVEVIDRNADFFDLGGHSLLAMRTIDRINRHFSAALSMVAFFENPCLYQQATLLKDSTGGEKIQAITASVFEGNEAPLSFTQERLWVLGQLGEASVAYNIVGGAEIHGALDMDCLELAYKDVVRRHRIMRSYYVMTDEGLRQRFHKDIDGLAIERLDLTEYAEAEALSEAAIRIRQLSLEAFDLSKFPLFRLVAIEITPRRFQLVSVFQHIIFDGWSSRVFVHELQDRYRQLQLGQSEPMPVPAIDFADYAVWQRNRLEAEGQDNEQTRYWLSKLGKNPTLLDLPYDRPRPLQPSFLGNSIIRYFSRDLTQRIKGLAKAEGASVFILLMAAFKVLLYRYSGESHITVGSPVAGRRTPELEDLIGCFINTLPLRSEIVSDAKFRDVLASVRKNCLEGLDHQDVPLTYLSAELLKQGWDGVAPMFQTLLVFQNYEQPTFGIPGLNVEPLHLANGGAQFELSLFMAEQEDRIQVYLQYNSNLFDESTAERIFQHYSTLLDHITLFPQAPVDRIPLLPESERDTVLTVWNRADSNPLPVESLPELLSESFRSNAGKVAIESNNKSLSYRELDERANSIAAALVSRGVAIGELIGISMQRGPEMVAAILGIHRAGAAYLPLDPGFPLSRLDYMVSDSETRLILTDEVSVMRLSELTCAVDKLKVGDIPAITDAPPVDAWKRQSESPLAYLLYTSGSTGKPKGVLVGQRSVINFLQSMLDEPGLTSDDILVAVTTLSFDISVLELLLPLLAGATLVLADERTQSDGTALAKLLAKSGATVAQSTPATWRMLLDSGWKAAPGFKILCGGEAMTRNLADDLLANGAEVWNMYGPTETTVWSTCTRVAKDGPVHVGKPIANTAVYVLNDHLEPVPIGVPGELFIAGDGLALGYFDRPDLTAERFIPDPFSKARGARMYRTGDEVKLAANGDIQWLRRKDNQIKLRGFRIELGEIEQVVGNDSGVAQCKVLLVGQTDIDRRIVAFVTGKGDQSLSAVNLRRHALKALPPYMAPYKFVQLDEFPLTPNGKIDSEALAKRETFERHSNEEYVPPQGELECQLANIWIKVLTVEKVSRDDNFFMLGGNSLSAVQVITDYARECRKNIKPQYLRMRSLKDVAALAESLSDTQEHAET